MWAAAGTQHVAGALRSGGAVARGGGGHRLGGLGWGVCATEGVATELPVRAAALLAGGGAAGSPRAEAVHPLLGRKVEVATEQQVVFEGQVSEGQPEYLVGTACTGQR